MMSDASFLLFFFLPYKQQIVHHAVPPSLQPPLRGVPVQLSRPAHLPVDRYKVKYYTDVMFGLDRNEFGDVLKESSERD